MSDPTSVKRALRSELRALRRALPDQPERSDRIWSTVQAIDAVFGADVVMAFDSIQGEPLTAPFVAWCRAAGKRVVFPEDDPTPDPAVVDVVIVPGVAFTRDGDRLGQGGGWYDRFLADIRPDCVTVGVGFEPQVVSSLPIEPHDRRLDLVVTDAGVVAASCCSTEGSPARPLP